MLKAWQTGDVHTMLEASKLWPYTRELRERPAYYPGAPVSVVGDAFKRDPWAIDLSLRMAVMQTDPTQRGLWVQYVNSIQKFNPQKQQEVSDLFKHLSENVQKIVKK